jgi:hypothetical protein
VSINPGVYFEGGDQAFLESHPYFIIKKVNEAEGIIIFWFGSGRHLGHAGSDNRSKMKFLRSRGAQSNRRQNAISSFSRSPDNLNDYSVFS